MSERIVAVIAAISRTDELTRSADVRLAKSSSCVAASKSLSARCPPSHYLRICATLTRLRGLRMLRSHRELCRRPDDFGPPDRDRIELSLRINTEVVRKLRTSRLRPNSISESCTKNFSGLLHSRTNGPSLAKVCTVNDFVRKTNGCGLTKGPLVGSCGDKSQ